MTTLLHSLPALLLTAITAADAQAGNTPALLPASLIPAGLRLQATFAASRPDQGMAVFWQNGHTHLRRAGSDLGNGLQLRQILADRAVLAHAGREYYLPLQQAPAHTRRLPAIPARTSSPGTSPVPAGIAAVAAQPLQAANQDEIRQQCDLLPRLSTEQRQEIQALGLCP